MSPETKPRLCLVEDNDFYARSLSRYLEQELRAESPEISVFHSGESAVSFIGESHPDLVILDYSLGDPAASADGDWVLRKIRELSPKTAVIMLSSCREISLAVKLIRTGAMDYIVKSPGAFSAVKEDVLNFLLKKEEQLQSRKFIFSAAMVCALILGITIVAFYHEFTH